jgi:uncharacterized RDD family membrane protein YckC
MTRWIAMNTSHPDIARSWGLPDPDTHAEFYADVPTKRLLAWVVDSILILLLTLLAIPFTAFVGLFFFAFLWLAVSLVYRIATLGRSSATPGMRLMAIEMRTGRGERFDPLTATLHTVIYLAMLTTVVPQAVSILLMLTGSRAQGLHDLLLGTAAINRARAI